MSFQEAMEEAIPMTAKGIPAEVIASIQHRICKNETGSTGSRKYKYITLDKLIQVCAENGVVVTFTMDKHNSFKIHVLFNSKYICTSTLDIPEAIKANTIQDFGSIITYARRYLMLMAVGLHPKDEDDDGQISVNKTSNTPPQTCAVKHVENLNDMNVVHNNSSYNVKFVPQTQSPLHEYRSETGSPKYKKPVNEYVHEVTRDTN